MKQVEQGTDFDIRNLATSLRRRLPLILLCTLLAAGAALAASLSQTNKYTAEASLLFRDPGFDSQLFGSSIFTTSDPAREAATNVELVSLEAVAKRTAENLQETGEADLTGPDVTAMIDVQAEGQADLVTVAATDVDPEFAAALANAFSRNYIEFRRDADRSKIQAAQRSLETNIASLEAEGITPEDEDGNENEVQGLEEQLSQLQTLQALQTGNAELVQTADVPTSPSSPTTSRNVALGGFLGLLFGMALALLLERLDRRLRDAGELEAAYGLPSLAHVPVSRALGRESSESDRGFAELEPFRMLRTRLRYFNVDRNLRSLLVTSATPGEGKSTIASNLAMSSATSGIKTILIEADFHQPVLAERTGLAYLPGLSELLTHQGALKRTVQQITVAQGQTGRKESLPLDVLVAGATPPAPMELLESKVFSDLLEMLSERYELVIIDTPPATVMADAIPLISRVDGVLIVCRVGHTTRDAASHLREQLDRLNAPVLGTIINGVKPRRGGYGYYYMYGSSGRGSSRSWMPRRKKPSADTSTLSGPSAPATSPISSANGSDSNDAETAAPDLNHATFEELRQLGLSISQATELISRREASPLRSVEQLVDLPSFEDELVNRLENTARV